MNSDKTISEFINDVMRARAEAFRQNIKANAVLINKNLVKIPELRSVAPLGACVTPPMICGLGVYDAGELLPEDYAFAVTHIESVEEIEQIVKERGEYKHRAEVAEMALKNAAPRLKCRGGLGKGFCKVDKCDYYHCNNDEGCVKAHLRQAEKELEEGKDA